jgi:hypothetical protein
MYFWRSGVSPSLGDTLTALASTAAVTPTNMSGCSVAGCVMSAATTSRLEPAAPLRPPCVMGRCLVSDADARRAART